MSDIYVYRVLDCCDKREADRQLVSSLVRSKLGRYGYGCRHLRRFRETNQASDLIVICAIVAHVGG